MRAAGALVAALLGAASPAATPPDRQAAAAILEQFRQMVWSEPIYAEFDLRQMPRRGGERLAQGRFWGGRNALGPVTRLELATGGGGFAHRFLLQGGPGGGVWTSDGPGAGTPDPGAMMRPLAPGFEMTPFDVLPMPYLYWLDWEMVGLSRVRGRQAYVFVFTPPGDFPALHPSVRSVRAYLDSQYDALVQSEVSGADGRVAKTLSLLELRKVGDRWIPKDLDVRNEATRDKTRLTLTGVAIGVPQDPQAFDPAQLGSALEPPSTKRVIRLNL